MRKNVIKSIAILLHVFFATPHGTNATSNANNGSTLNPSTASGNEATSEYSALSSLASSLSSLTKLPSALRFPKRSNDGDKEVSNSNKEHLVNKKKNNSKPIAQRRKNKLKSNSAKKLIRLPKDKATKMTMKLPLVPPYRFTWCHSLRSLFQFMTFQSTKYKEYIRILKDQVIHLQRQIRLHQEEIKQLREKIQLQKNSKRIAFASSILSRQKTDKSQKLLIQKYELEIKSLNKQINKMTLLQDELEIILQTELEKVSNLEKENEEYQEEIETLHHRIEELHALQKDTLDLVEKERQYFKEKIKEEQQKVEEERQKGLLAVQEEKIKMRKLVKALAMKKHQNKK